MNCLYVIVNAPTYRVSQILDFFSTLDRWCILVQKLGVFKDFLFWFGLGWAKSKKLNSPLIWKHWSSLRVAVQCSIFPGFISDVSTQRNSFFSIVLGFYMECFKMRAFLVLNKYIQKSNLFEISHIKTKNNTENWIPLGANITNEARKDWTLHLHPRRALMFSNERTIQFFGLGPPQTKPKQKILENPNLWHKNTSSVQCAKKIKNLTHPTP